MSEVFETLRPCCKDLADASERGWRPNVTSFPLSQALHDEWPCERQLLHRFGIASLRVFVSWFLQKRVTRASFFPLSHVISEVNVIYGCQEVPRSALMPEKTLTWVGWGMEGLRNCLTHEMLWCISCVKRPWGGPVLDPVAWKNFRGCLVHCPPGQTPELISFISSSCWREGGTGLVLLLPLLVLWDLCFCQANRLREMWLCPPSLPPFSLCYIAPLIPTFSLPPLSLSPCSLPPSLPLPYPLFLSLPGPLSWTSIPLAFSSSFLPQFLH